MLETNKIILGDCIEELKKLPDNSVDAIVTDPPYGLEFMGKQWDKFSKGENIAGGNTGKDTPYARSKPTPAFYHYELSDKRTMQMFFMGWALECWRVLKPGGFLLSFGGTRTYHRMTCGIEDAGFEIRDCIMWLYGSGFPKSLNIGKQIDKMSYEEVGTKYNEWNGWGTALKPSCEPIVVARKPLSEKNVALNVLKHGTGGINIDACRIGTEIRINKGMSAKQPECAGTFRDDNWKPKEVENIARGRFPANLILDEESGKMLDEQSGITNQGHWSKTKTFGYGNFGNYCSNKEVGKSKYFGVGIKDKTKAGASRFFYCAKASKSERNYGCEEFEDKQKCPMSKESRIGECINASKGMERFETICKNNHPCVKPIKLMQYLIRLVCRKGGLVLDPFIGSGTTALACIKEGMNYIGIEKEEDYIKIAQARINKLNEQQRLG